MSVQQEIFLFDSCAGRLECPELSESPRDDIPFLHALPRPDLDAALAAFRSKWSPEAPSSVLLENGANIAAKPTTRQAERRRAQGFLRRITTVARVEGCGNAIGAEVRLRGAVGPQGTTAGMAGLATCGSVWVCPVCASKIAMTRTDDLEAGIRHWAEHGGSFSMLTLTLQHSSGDRLAELWDALSGAWRRFVSDGSAKRLRTSLGVVGYHRTTEATYGANGWHVHLHVLYFLEGSVSDLLARADSGALVARWVAAVEAVGYRAVSDAQDWKVLRGNADALASVAGYVIKGEYRERESRMPRNARQIAMEATRGDLKSARVKSSRTPFEILADVVDSIESTGEIPERDLELWHEWESASHGRRQQVWSRGMRDRLGLNDELSDEEAAAVEVEGVDMLAISASEWERFTRDPNAHAELIGAVEQAGSIVTGRIAAAEVLARHGITFRMIFPEVE